MKRQSVFSNEAAEFVYVRTYSRWIEIEKKRENWKQTSDRYINFLKKQLGDKIPVKVLKKIEEKLYALEVMPSMRFLWAAGEAAEFDSTTIYNCSFAAVDYVNCFAEALYILMCGSGFGFSVENKYINRLPTVPTTIVPNGQVHEVEDSKAGWADSIKVLVSSLYAGNDIEITYNKVRPAGARLKVMGGRASGPGPLAQLHSFIRDTFYEARGRKLTSGECHDIMCEIAQIVVVGGVRRSSEISLSDLLDEKMRDAKTGNFPVRRYMANNSAVYTEKPDIVTFMKEWAALINSKSGERGIFNLESAQKMAPKRREAHKIAGTNPCVTGDTEILTRDGYKPINLLINQESEIWNGFEWSKVIPIITGENQETLTVTFSDGRKLRCTPYHKFHIAQDYNGNVETVVAKDLTLGLKLIKHKFPIIEHGLDIENKYAYTQGFISAEGMDDYNFLWVYKPKYMCLGRLLGVPMKEYNERIPFKFNDNFNKKCFVPHMWNLRSKLNWLSGLFDGDGTELQEGGLQLASVNHKFLFDVQKLLSTIGIQCKVIFANKEGYKLMPDGHGGHKEFWCQETKRLCIGAMQMQDLKKLGMKCERMSFDKYPNRDASQFITVVNISKSEVADFVYCFSETKRHMGIFNGILTGQCGEIQLRSREFCNLSEVVARAEDDIDTMLEKIETATWMGILQACFTNFPYLDKEWKANCDEERLLGVSITGQFDALHLFTEEALKAYKSKAIKVAKKASEIMEIPMPTAITCVKPSGSVSQLVDSSSGMHPRFSKYYIRRYRIASIDPLFRMIRDQGVSVSPENGQRKSDYVKAEKAYKSSTDKSVGLRDARAICSFFDDKGWSEEKVSTWIVSFPVESPKNSVVVEDINAIQQLEHYKKIQKFWCEHNASITIYVKNDEWLSVGDWVYKNWDIVNGISFLPHDDNIYEQPPYEKITKDQYEEMIAKFPKIDYTQLSKYELEDNTEGAKSLACVAGVCEIN